MKYTHRNYKGQYTAWAASRFGVAVLAGTIILSLAGWVERTNDPRCKGLFTPIACEDAFKNYTKMVAEMTTNGWKPYKWSYKTKINF